MTNENQLPGADTEIVVRLRSFREWQDWAKEHPYIFSPDHAAQVLAQIRSSGIVDPLSGATTAPHGVTIAHDNYRETIKTDKLISRHRGLLLELRHLASDSRPRLLSRQCRAYAPEGLTDFALFLRGIYPRFLGSEYADTDADRESLYPIPCEDLSALSMKDQAFDLVFSNDVFEHVPDLDLALKEVARILNERGILISTFPFRYSSESGIVRARIADGKLEYLTEPEYHGNPMKPDQGSLVFEIPGWDLIERARHAGFGDAYFSFICSGRHGVLGKGLNGVFVFVATKQRRIESPRTVAHSKSHGAARPGVASLIGLPRSGTTVFAAAIGAHENVKAVFEPWNAEKKLSPPVDMGMSKFIERFAVSFEPRHRLLLVKETAADLSYLEAIDHLLVDAASVSTPKLIWLYRDPLHVFLSEINARQAWWGEPDLRATSDTFTKWADRSLRAVRRLCGMARAHNALCVDYEFLVSDPAATLQVVMPFLGLGYSPAQLEYFSSLNTKEVRGDISVAKNPRAISRDSTAKRVEEAKLIHETLGEAKYFDEIDQIRSAADSSIANRLPSMRATKEFLDSISRCSWFADAGVSS